MATLLPLVLGGLPQLWSRKETDEWVDLGLPSGTLWAKKNIGATLITDAGLYFAWGELVGYTGGSHQFNNTTYDPSAAAISANLSLSQDAARSILGGDWRMPTKTEFQELINFCSYTITTKDGVSVGQFTSSINGKVLLMPRTGFQRNYTIIDTTGQYWSSTYVSESNAYALSFWTGNVTIHEGGEPYRYQGCPIRAVRRY